MSVPAPRVDLRAAARSEAIGIVLAGGAALVASPFVLALGSVLLIGLVLGPLLLVAGLVAIPYGLYRAAFPMSHPAIRALGSTDAERAAGLAAVEAELASARIAGLRLASGVTLELTPRFLVARGKDLVIAQREDLLWGYGRVTTRKRYGITTGRSNDVCLVTRRTGEHTFSSRDAQETASALELVRRASGRAFVGYRDDLAAMTRERLASAVDRVPFDAGGAYPLPSAASAWAPEPAAPPAPSAAPFWALLAAAVIIAGAGLLLGLLFGWIATHPDEPDDVRFGGFCSIASVLVCFFPGAAAAAFSLWRLFLRAPARA